jgi:hypothetical protein
VPAFGLLGKDSSETFDLHLIVHTAEVISMVSPKSSFVELDKLFENTAKDYR